MSRTEMTGAEKWLSILCFTLSVCLLWATVNRDSAQNRLNTANAKVEHLLEISDSLKTQINWFERYLQPNIDSISRRSGNTLITRLLISHAVAAGIPPVLLASLARVESNYTPAARGTSGESGMLQVIPRLWWRLVVDKCGYWEHGDLETEICAGAQVLSWYYYTKCKEESWMCALSRYNTGIAPARSTVGRAYANAVLTGV